MRIRNARIRVNQGYPSVEFEAFLRDEWRRGLIFSEIKPTLVANELVPIEGNARIFLDPVSIDGGAAMEGLSADSEPKALLGLLKLRRGAGAIDTEDSDLMEEGRAAYDDMKTLALQQLA